MVFIKHVEVPALGHNWNEWETVYPATYDSSGLKRHSCTRCNIAETESIPQLGRTNIADAVIMVDPTAVLTYADAPSVTVTLDGRTLTEGMDYTLSYSNNDAPGTATVTVTGTGAYAGNASANYEVVAASPSISYDAHVANEGWHDGAWKSDGTVAGATGKAWSVQALRIALRNVADAGIEYSTHVQDYGDMPYVSNGAMSGTSGESKRFEAIRIHLTGGATNAYDVYYRVHAENFGWLEWAKDGEDAGTSGYGYRLEAVEIRMVPKGGAAPGPTSTPYHNKATEAPVSSGPSSGSSGNPTAPSVPSNTVYILSGSPYAKSYHKSPGCRSLVGSKYPVIGVSLDEARRRGLTDPCNNCYH